MTLPGNPNRIDLGQTLDQLQKTKTVRRQAVRLAEGWLLPMGIRPEGIDLVVWLADSRCRNNRTALVQWIETQLAEPGSWIDEIPDSTAIRQRLGCVLSCIEESVL